MEKVIKYKCKYCNKLFDYDNLEHENRHLMIDKANELLQESKTLLEINNETHIWNKIPEYLENVTKDNCFIISHWQCCFKPVYKIISIEFYEYNGKMYTNIIKLYLRGCGSWKGYYGKYLDINSKYLNNPRPKEELFINSRYGR